MDKEEKEMEIPGGKGGKGGAVKKRSIVPGATVPGPGLVGTPGPRGVRPSTATPTPTVLPTPSPVGSTNTTTTAASQFSQPSSTSGASVTHTGLPQQVSFLFKFCSHFHTNEIEDNIFDKCNG